MGWSADDRDGNSGGVVEDDDRSVSSLVNGDNGELVPVVTCGLHIEWLECFNTSLGHRYLIP